jgi:uncharacterized protein YjbI with pentapeptide repeats
MANPFHLAILERGVGVWNRWREENPEIEPDLMGLELYGTALRVADLTREDRMEVNLHEANFRTAKLAGANLATVYLTGADLGFADLRRANLDGADLRGASLSGAHLSGANLSRTYLDGAELTGAIFGDTILGNVDLSGARGLAFARHYAKSSIGIDTFFRSQGRIPHIFLRGAGVPENLIEYMAALVGVGA